MILPWACKSAVPHVFLKAGIDGDLLADVGLPVIVPPLGIAAQPPARIHLDLPQRQLQFLIEVGAGQHVCESGVPVGFLKAKS